MNINPVEGNGNWIRFMQQVEAARNRNSELQSTAKTREKGEAGIRRVAGSPLSTYLNAQQPVKLAELDQSEKNEKLTGTILGTRFDSYA